MWFKKLFTCLFFLLFFVTGKTQSICGSLINFNLSITNGGNICDNNDSLVVSFNASFNDASETSDFILMIYQDSNGTVIDSGEHSIVFSTDGPQSFTFYWNLYPTGNNDINYDYGNNKKFFLGTFTMGILVVDRVGGGTCYFPGGVFTFSDTPPSPPTNTTIASALTIYSGNITELTASGTGTLGWYSSDTGGIYLGTGSSFITPPLANTTTFYVQDSNCGTSSRTAITVTVNAMGTGIAAINESDIICLYPNPSNGNIYFKGISYGKIEIYNDLGQTIYTDKVNANNYSINMTGNSKGIYLYRVTDNKVFIQQGKFVIE